MAGIGGVKVNFAERNGFSQSQTIQLNFMDEALRNRLYNITIKFLNPSPEKDNIIEFVVDKLGFLSVGNTKENSNVFNTHFLNLTNDIKWYKPYEILELIIEARKWLCKSCDYDCHERGRDCAELSWLEAFPKAINQVLVEEKSGYRMINDIFVPITDEIELESISHSMQTHFNSVNIHMKKAIELYADRQNPDYENSIKESISGVEAMCCIITGVSGANATLGKALKKLKDNGIIIHGAMETAFSNLYGYTSDADGIRHGGIDFTNAPAEDAKYMLVSCSTFVNYLFEKLSILEDKKTNG